MDALEDQYELKKEAATEVHTYLTNNFYGYLDELLSHVYSGASGAEKDDLIATALDSKDAFLADVMSLNESLEKSMTKKMMNFNTIISQVKSGREERQKIDHKGFVATDADGNPIILQTATSGWISKVRDIEDKM